jgi:hypothetical protein
MEEAVLVHFPWYRYPTCFPFISFLPASIISG